MIFYLKFPRNYQSTVEHYQYHEFHDVAQPSFNHLEKYARKRELSKSVSCILHTSMLLRFKVVHF